MIYEKAKEIAKWMWEDLTDWEGYKERAKELPKKVASRASFFGCLYVGALIGGPIGGLIGLIIGWNISETFFDDNNPVGGPMI